MVRERIAATRSVVLLVDVSGSMRGERVRTAAATVGALAAELSRDNLAVVAFWSDAAVLCRLGQRIGPQALVESMVRIPARGLTNVAFPLQVAARELARIPARDARVMLLSDCVHNAGPIPGRSRPGCLGSTCCSTRPASRTAGWAASSRGSAGGSSGLPVPTVMSRPPSVRSSPTKQS